MECKHKAQVYAMCNGGDKTELSYIIVAATVEMFTKGDFSDCTRVPRGVCAFACVVLFNRFLDAFSCVEQGDCSRMGAV